MNHNNSRHNDSPDAWPPMPFCLYSMKCNEDSPLVKRRQFVFLMAVVLMVCFLGEMSWGVSVSWSADPSVRPKRVLSESLRDIDHRYYRIRRHIHRYGQGGQEVLRVAWQTLRQGRAKGRWSLVGLEDMWTHALQEGRSLFAHPHRLWGATYARETADMLGQTTIGPWQITVKNIRERFGRPYRITGSWSRGRIVVHCQRRPHIQAAMIADYLQQSYEQYGLRSPYAIQNYFWLEGYLRRWIGQAAWDVSVLPRRPTTGWRSLTPNMKANTGFYAKQIILGTPGHPYGFLYWLWISRDRTAIRHILHIWHTQPRMQWDLSRQIAVITANPGDFTIQPSDLRYLPQTHHKLRRFLLREMAEMQKR